MSTAAKIVDKLLEAEEFDYKAFLNRHNDKLFNVWTQVDGDVDWWEYGGTFHNAGQGMMVHILGIEQAGLKDWASWDMTITPEDEATLLARLPVEIDPEYPEEGDQNEDIRQEEADKLRDERAEQKNANRKMPVYRWLDDNIEDYSDYFQEMEEQVGEDITDWPVAAKWAWLGQHLGWDELDSSPDNYTWAELDKYLQPREDFRGMSRQRNQLPDNP